jgi:hypothetical protein
LESDIACKASSMIPIPDSSSSICLRAYSWIVELTSFAWYCYQWL